jgi:phosphotransferase system enzyme I (PtsI)
MREAPTSTTIERTFRGTPVSDGVAHGVVRQVGEFFEEPISRKIPSSQVESEMTRFHHALAGTQTELESLISRLDGEEDQNARDILDMHLLVLQDVMMNGPVEKAIRQQLDSAEVAYYRVARSCMDSFHKMPDAYFRERALDIRDVAQRVLRHLRGEQRKDETDGAPAICIAHDLTPSETAHLDRATVLGFAIEQGSKTSHTAIIARSLGLPAVVHLHGICEALREGDRVLLDGHEGLLILNPTNETLTRYRGLKRQAEQREARLLVDCREAAVTLDGTRITVAANAEFEEELPHIKLCGAEGIGLFRTEFLYLENPDADEARLTEVYTNVAAALAPELVIFRTLDLGGDKLDPAYGAEREANPFLGWRGIRVSLSKHDFFKRQLRAILRASAHGNVGIMYPMVCSVHEVIAASKLVAECRHEVESEGLTLPGKVPVGAMIEIPSAAATADLIAPHVDFFSIGTNDLIQYTLAVDRVNERVAELYQPTHPAVLRLIKTVIEAGNHVRIWTGMCGEMAGDVSVTPLLVGLGLTELSAASSQVARVKHAVRRLNAAECRALVGSILSEADPAVIWQRAADIAHRAYPELFEE